MHNSHAEKSTFTQIREFLSKAKMEYNAQFNVILYTSFGKLICDLEPFARSSSALGFTDDPTIFTLDASAIFDGTSETNMHLVNAKNVIAYDHSGKELMRTEQMIIFADQILGFSLINKQV